MAELKSMIITEKGHNLMAKMLLGEAKGGFSKIRLSQQDYLDADIEAIEELEDICQETDISRIDKVNGATIKIEAAVTNEDLTTGYHLRTVGLYALDPDEGEILYAVSVVKQYPDYIPPYNDFSISGIYLKLYTTVSNSEQVNLQVDPSTYATVGDIEELRRIIDEIYQNGTLGGTRIIVSEEMPEDLGEDNWWYQPVRVRKETEDSGDEE